MSFQNNKKKCMKNFYPRYGKKCFDGDNPLAIVRTIIAVDYEHLSKKEYSSRLRNLVSKNASKRS